MPQNAVFTVSFQSNIRILWHSVFVNFRKELSGANLWMDATAASALLGYHEISSSLLLLSRRKPTAVSSGPELAFQELWRGDVRNIVQIFGFRRLK